MEWVFKWLKIALLIGLILLMILIRAGGVSEVVIHTDVTANRVWQQSDLARWTAVCDCVANVRGQANLLDYEISPGYKSTGFFVNDKQPAIPGTGGRILAVW